MDGYDAATYGDRIADVYDTFYGQLAFGGDIGETVLRLLELAEGRPMLELGIGTGRVALRLVEAGAEIHGIDASEAMVARLRGKPGGHTIPVTIGDFADFSLDARFGVVYVVFNTFFGLLTQEDQVGCFRAVARHLAPGGRFVMEAFMPDLGWFDRGQRVSAVRVGTDEVTIEVSKHDRVSQRTDSQQIVVREDGVHLYPVRIRYAFPAELDLMARIAEMRLRERWGDWDRRPLTDTSPKHVSVWELEP